MPKKVVINMKRVAKVNAASKKIMAEYKKETKRSVPKTGFVLDLSKMKLGGAAAKCHCLCSTTMDCGGGGGGH